MNFKEFFGSLFRIPSRSAARVRTFNLLKYSFRKPGFSSAAYMANILDLSEGGLQFISEEKAKVGDTVDMTIHLVEENQECGAVGRVAWLKVNKGGGYYLGISFIDLALEHKLKIKNFLNK